MIRILCGVFIATIATVSVLAVPGPHSFNLERRLAIDAPPETVLACLNDLRRWSAWSTWEKKDPAERRNYGIPTVGEGAACAWNGNPEVGRGYMRSVESGPVSQLRLASNFEKRMRAHNELDFALTPVAVVPRVVRGSDRQDKLPSRLIQVLVSMDSRIGQNFEAAGEARRGVRS